MSSGARILAATDLSVPAAWAEERAARLAAGTGGSLDLLHVVGTGPLLALHHAALGTRVPEAVEHARAELDRSASGLAQTWRIPVRTHVERGSVSQEILRRVEIMRPDLLVVGAHGGHFVHELLFGSTAERLLLRTPVPFLVVKGMPRAEYATGLIGTDFSGASRAAVRAACALLPHVRFSLYHAAEALEEGFAHLAGLDDAARGELRAEALAQARTQMDRFVEQCATPDLPGRVEYGYPVAMIEAAVARDASDVLVLGKSGRSALEHWAVGSVTAHLVRTVPSDVLVVPSGEREESPGAPSVPPGA